MRLPHLFGPATRPFSFFGCLELREILGRRARDERELMEGLEQIPAGSIYYHTHSIFLRHPHIGGGYPNDFANWVATQVGDKGLAERLAVVDPYRLATVEELREELVSVVESHIATLQPVPRCVFGDPFFFVQSHVFEVPTGLEARSLSEFRRCLAEAGLSAVYLHTLHARVRGEVAGGDFAHWIGQELGLDSLAGAIGRINPFLGGRSGASSRATPTSTPRPSHFTTHCRARSRCSPRRCWATTSRSIGPTASVSARQRRVWTFLRRFVVRYDAAVFSLPAFAQQLPIPQCLAYPSIDPLADKNRRMSAKEVKKTLERLGVPDDKPILLQVSRFDRFKDPIGVINAYKLVKGYHDVRLVLAGGGATDDPEGAAVLNDVREAARRDPDIYLLDLPSNAHLASTRSSAPQRS